MQVEACSDVSSVLDLRQALNAFAKAAGEGVLKRQTTTCQVEFGGHRYYSGCTRRVCLGTDETKSGGPRGGEFKGPRCPSCGAQQQRPMPRICERRQAGIPRCV